MVTIVTGIAHRLQECVYTAFVLVGLSLCAMFIAREVWRSLLRRPCKTCGQYRRHHVIWSPRPHWEVRAEHLLPNERGWCANMPADRKTPALDADRRLWLTVNQILRKSGKLNP